jgi:uncharacterized Zn finger protein
MKEANINQIMTDQEVVTCPNCGNVYKVELLKQGDDYNDFGYRYCPFCGLVTDEYANIS